MDTQKSYAKDAIHVRPFRPDDEAFVLSLAPRLLVGIAPWRSPERMLATVKNWLADGIKQQQRHIFVAEDERSERLGFASVSREQNFTGEEQAYIGELAISEAAEGLGVGRALIAACEQWARNQGYGLLVLHTGAANVHARGFYQRLGFLEEDVKLVKVLT